MAALQFDVQATDTQSKARAGTITTDHGIIQTPVFMPVGTVGSVKAVSQQQLQHDVKARIILGNTYHLYLRPGLEILEAAGGLHRFNGWQGPVLTDSGGYQVFSLAANRRISPEGVVFQSHIDGSKHLFTPENVMDTQRVIGGDIIMAFDECPPHTSTPREFRAAVERTIRWARECREQPVGRDGRADLREEVHADLDRYVRVQNQAEIGRVFVQIDQQPGTRRARSGHQREEQYELTETIHGSPPRLLTCLVRSILAKPMVRHWVHKRRAGTMIVEAKLMSDINVIRTRSSRVAATASAPSGKAGG